MENSSTQIAVYNEFRNQLATLKEANKSIVFNYDTLAGEKEARSHIFKLRQTKTAVDKAREAEKKASLDYGRLVDSQAKEIIGEIEAMIDIHAKPIREKEERDKKRVEAIQERIRRIAIYLECKGHDLQELQSGIKTLESMVIDESFCEFMAEALNQKNAALQAHKFELEIALKREMEKQELECLRKEQAEREQAEREAKLIAEAEARATAAAEAKAAAEKVAVEKLQKDAAEASAKRERELVEEKERAEKKAQQAAENARREEEAKAKKLRDEEAAREADKNHKIKIHNDIIFAMTSHFGITEEQALVFISNIRSEKIPHMKIIY